MTVETELKLVCDQVTLRRIARHPAVRSLKAGRARTERLTSTYFDTPDRRLARDGLALRVRRTPRGWVQTLKGEGKGVAGLQARPEWEWPVAGNAVAGDLLINTPALKALGGRKHFAEKLASLMPVFGTDFTRTSHPLRFPDGTRADLCLDLGELRAAGRSEPVSEAEIELREKGSPVIGQIARLFDLPLVLAAELPVRLGHLSKAERGQSLARRVVRVPCKAAAIVLDKRMTQAEALRAIASGCMAHMQANEAGLLSGRDPEYLHQMRVAIRRLRSATSVFRQRVEVDALAPVAVQARVLGRQLGTARDWDVFCVETLRSIVRAFPDEPGLARLARRAARLRIRHGLGARAAVGSADYTCGLLRLAQLLASAEVFVDHQAEALPGFAAAVLQKRHRRVRRLGDRLAELSPQDLHGLRISAKKLRYAAEFFQGIFRGRGAHEYAAALSRLQDVLGGLNDVAAAERLLGELESPRGASEVAFGIVRGWLGARRRRCLDDLPAAWSKFCAQPRFWKRALLAPPESAAAPERSPMVDDVVTAVES